MYEIQQGQPSTPLHQGDSSPFSSMSTTNINGSNSVKGGNNFNQGEQRDEGEVEVPDPLSLFNSSRPTNINSINNANNNNNNIHSNPNSLLNHIPPLTQPATGTSTPINTYTGSGSFPFRFMQNNLGGGSGHQHLQNYSSHFNTRAINSTLTNSNVNGNHNDLSGSPTTNTNLNPHNNSFQQPSLPLPLNTQALHSSTPYAYQLDPFSAVEASPTHANPQDISMPSSRQGSGSSHSGLGLGFGGGGIGMGHSTGGFSQGLGLGLAGTSLGSGITASSLNSVTPSWQRFGIHHPGLHHGHGHGHGHGHSHSNSFSGTTSFGQGHGPGHGHGHHGGHSAHLSINPTFANAFARDHDPAEYQSSQDSPCDSSQTGLGTQPASGLLLTIPLKMEDSPEPMDQVVENDEIDENDNVNNNENGIGVGVGIGDGDGLDKVQAEVVVRPVIEDMFPSQPQHHSSDNGNGNGKKKGKRNASGKAKRGSIVSQMELGGIIATEFDSFADVKKSDGKSATFLTKLYQILDTPEYQHMIHWDDEGYKIVIDRPGELERHVLPLVYKQSRFASFSRQLNIYGWLRIGNLRNVDKDITDQDASQWSHHTLNRNSAPEELTSFKRRVPPRAHGRKASNASSGGGDDNFGNTAPASYPSIGRGGKMMGSLPMPRRTSQPGHSTRIPPYGHPQRTPSLGGSVDAAIRRGSGLPIPLSPATQAFQDVVPPTPINRPLPRPAMESPVGIYPASRTDQQEIAWSQTFRTQDIERAPPIQSAPAITQSFAFNTYPYSYGLSNTSPYANSDAKLISDSIAPDAIPSPVQPTYSQLPQQSPYLRNDMARNPDMSGRGVMVLDNQTQQHIRAGLASIQGVSGSPGNMMFQQGTPNFGQSNVSSTLGLNFPLTPQSDHSIVPRSYGSNRGLPYAMGKSYPGRHGSGNPVVPYPKSVDSWSGGSAFVSAMARSTSQDYGKSGSPLKDSGIPLGGTEVLKEAETQELGSTHQELEVDVEMKGKEGSDDGGFWTPEEGI